MHFEDMMSKCWVKNRVVDPDRMLWSDPDPYFEVGSGSGTRITITLNFILRFQLKKNIEGDPDRIFLDGRIRFFSGFE